MEGTNNECHSNTYASARPHRGEGYAAWNPRNSHSVSSRESLPDVCFVFRSIWATPRSGHNPPRSARVGVNQKRVSCCETGREDLETGSGRRGDCGQTVDRHLLPAGVIVSSPDELCYLSGESIQTKGPSGGELGLHDLKSSICWWSRLLMKVTWLLRPALRQRRKVERSLSDGQRSYRLLQANRRGPKMLQYHRIAAVAHGFRSSRGPEQGGGRLCEVGPV